MKFDAVFFDSGGTIYNIGYRGAVSDPHLDRVSAGGPARAAAALRGLGHQVSDEVVAEKLDAAKELVKRKRRPGLPSNEESLISELYEELELPVCLEEILYVTGIYSGPRYRSWLFPDVHEVLGRLRAAGVYIGLIANTGVPGWIMDRNFRGVGLLEFFGVRIYSGDEGVSKPDPSIFQLAAERAGMNGKRLAYVGNSLQADIAGARAAGWSSVLLRSSEKTSSGLADFEIDAWKELPDIVL